LDAVKLLMKMTVIAATSTALRMGGDCSGRGRADKGRSLPIVENKLGQAQPSLQRVLDVLGEDAVDRIGLMPRQSRQAMGRAVGAREAQDRLHHPQ
jgi:hypothetical protein